MQKSALKDEAAMLAARAQDLNEKPFFERGASAVGLVEDVGAFLMRLAEHVERLEHAAPYVDEPVFDPATGEETRDAWSSAGEARRLTADPTKGRARNG